MHLGYWPGAADTDLAAAQARLDALVLDHADLRDGQVLLDVGCGIGGTLRAAGRRNDLVLHGLSPDAAQLRVAREAVPEASFHEGRAGRLPFANGSVDRVLSVEAAFHFDSRAGFLSEARRVLRPGGRIVLTDIVPTERMAELRRSEGPAFALERVLQEGIGPWVDLWGTTPGWTELCTPSVHLDITEPTVPSYPCFLGPRIRAVPGVRLEGDDPMTPAVALLGWLQETGHVRVVLVVVEH